MSLLYAVLNTRHGRRGRARGRVDRRPLTTANNADITISGRVIRIGRNIYPLAPIIQVSTVKMATRRWRAHPNPGRRAIAALIGMALFIIPAGLVTNRFIDGLLVVVAAISVLVGVPQVIFFSGVFLFQKVVPAKYSLVILAGGAAVTLLTSSDQRGIREAAQAITAALETPPVADVVVHVGDGVMNDTFTGREAAGE